MLLRDLYLAFLDSLISLHLWLINFIGYLSLCASNLKFSFSCSNLNWVLPQNIFVTKFSIPSLLCHCVLSDPLTGLTFTFPMLEPQWLNLGPLPVVNPHYGMDFLLL